MSHSQFDKPVWKNAPPHTAAIADCEIRLVDGINGPVALGYAAPHSGVFSCAISLSAGEDSLGIAKAARYSAEALNAGYRFGWCGFKVDGLELAAALHDTVELRCSTSGKIVATWPSIDLLSRPKTQPQRPFLKVDDLRIIIRSAYGCDEPSHVKVFADAFRQFRGDYALVAATYSWLLRRTPAGHEVDNMIKGLDRGWNFLAVVERIMNSEEFNLRQTFIALGPFEANFPFELEAVWG